jgi:hypothetical protein
MHPATSADAQIVAARRLASYENARYRTGPPSADAEDSLAASGLLDSVTPRPANREEKFLEGRGV